MSEYSLIAGLIVIFILLTRSFMYWDKEHPEKLLNMGLAGMGLLAATVAAPIALASIFDVLSADRLFVRATLLMTLSFFSFGVTFCAFMSDARPKGWTRPPVKEWLRRPAFALSVVMFYFSGLVWCTGFGCMTVSILRFLLK